jgi:hypothetical protein
MDVHEAVIRDYRPISKHQKQSTGLNRFRAQSFGPDPVNQDHRVDPVSIFCP